MTVEQPAITLRGLVAGAALALSAAAAPAQPCEPTAARHAARIAAQAPSATDAAPEIYGAHSFYQQVGERWFALRRQTHGWSLRVYDRAPGADGAVDLSAVTPPYGGAPNAREIFGWHFRSADNSGPNRGDVNAPQHQRAFLFARTPAGVAAAAPGTDPNAPRLVEPDANDGRGWLTVLDYGLADLDPGQRARMTYLRFEACLTWPKSDEERRREADAASAVFLPEEIEAAGSCGLDLDVYTLDAAVLPRRLVGDLDGDGSLDTVVPIRRLRDGKRGLALCRAGTWLHVLGMDGAPVGTALKPGYFDQMEAWRLVPSDHGNLGYDGAPEWPRSAGDVLLLERLEKELILLYWCRDRLCSQQVYRYVEP